MNQSDVIEAVLEPGTEEAPETFIRDGLLYCGKCGTPRQKRENVYGEEIVYDCLCRCQREAREREEAERRRRDEAWRIQELRERGLDRAYRAWTFEGDDGREPKMEYLRRYVEKWDEVKELGLGLLLWGDVGTGKTYGAACIANALIERLVSCRMTNFIRVANVLSGEGRDAKNQCIDDLVSYPLLVIDGLGAERSSEYIQEMVFEVIDARYRTGLPLIVTTNLTPEYLKNPEKVTYSRIYDRILEMTVPIKFTEKRRGALHEEKLQTFRELLGVAES